jgi:hypothetical protein
MIKLPGSRNHSCAHNNPGISLVQKGRSDETIAQFKEVLWFKPDDLDAKERLRAPNVPCRNESDTNRQPGHVVKTVAGLTFLGQSFKI